MSTTIFYLIVDIIILSLQLTGFICNGFILYLFATEKALRQNSSMQLLLLLTVADFFHSITTLPYTIYLTASWDPLYFNLNPYFTMISSAPFIVQLKIYLTLTISIAVERVLALYLPVTFRRLSSSSYAFVCLLFGLSLGSIDLLLEFTLSKFARVPNCPTVGCLLSPSFLTYWGISNMVMGVIVICLTTSILLKLRIIQQQSQTKRIVMNPEGNKFKQANRICGGILIVSLMFVTLPSIIVGIIEMMVASTFGVLGPFYIAGLLCAGTCNSVLYVVLNKDIRVLARKALCGKQLIPAASVSTI